MARRKGAPEGPAESGPLRVTVVGLGLLGGSMARALQRSPGGSRAWRVTGVAREEETVRRARAFGFVDDGTTDLRAGVAAADVVVFATPVRAMAPLAARAAPALPPGAVVTDVGSTKAELARALPPLLPAGVHYVGGHPMAGSERTGLDAADPHLFENALYVLTPPQADAPGLDRVKKLVAAVGAEPVLMTPEAHDRVVAAVSHLPHMVAAALVAAVGAAAETDPAALALAAGGFRDTTRVASGDPHMWRDIFLSNRRPVLDMLDVFEGVLRTLRKAVAAGDGAALVDALARARALRNELPRHRQGLLRPLCEIVVQLADKPGGIRRVAGRIADAGVNIKDIEVLRAREGEAGALRLAFDTPEDMDRALAALADAGFVARRRG